MAQQVRDSAYHIIDYKGATCFAVGLALVRITSAIFSFAKQRAHGVNYA